MHPINTTREQKKIELIHFFLNIVIIIAIIFIISYGIENISGDTTEEEIKIEEESIKTKQGSISHLADTAKYILLIIGILVIIIVFISKTISNTKVSVQD